MTRHSAYKTLPLEHGRAADDTTYGIQSLAEINVALHDNRERSGRAGDNTTFGTTLCGCKRHTSWTLQAEPSLGLDTGILVKRPAGTSDIGRDCRNNTSVQQSCLAPTVRTFPSENLQRRHFEPTVDRRVHCPLQTLPHSQER